MSQNENLSDRELVIVRFEDTGDGKTKMTLRHVGIPQGEITEMTQKSWNESFDKLDTTLV